MNLSIAAQKIDKSLPVPFYYQIVQILREVIQDEDISGQQELPFPSENELCDAFEVNRGTVRHALEMLEREGLIYREKGRGTFLRRRRLELDPTALCSTSEDLRARGWEPSVRLLGLVRMAPQPHVQRALDLVEGDLVWQVHRLRLANDEPISLQWSYVPCRLAPTLDQKDLTQSLFAILKKDYGQQLRTAEQTIRTRTALEEEAAMLQVSAGAALFEISRVTFDWNLTPVEHLDSLWRGDRYDLRVKLKAMDA